MTMRARRQRGLSIVELMIAMTLGLLILAGLTTVFVTSSESQRELQRSAQQIENGRYAMDLLTQDLHHAGFYGRYSGYPDGTTIPDPCITGNAAALAADLAVPVQGFIAPDQSSRPSLTGTTCANALLPSANLHPGSDILVIRRAETTPLRYPTDGLTPTVTSADIAISNEVYLQTDPATADIQFGNGAAIASDKKANGDAATIMQKNGSAEAIRKYRVHIYFVAPCSIPAGTSIVCTGSNDDAGSPLPTLKRLELSVSSGTLTFNTVPIAEGVDALKFEYGIDNSPSTANATTLRIGDGAPDLYIPNAVTATLAAVHLTGVVSAKVRLVARSPQTSPGYKDTKTYEVATPSTVLGAGTVAGTGLTYGPFNDAYKRHAYFSEVRVVNLSSRRENP